MDVGGDGIPGRGGDGEGTGRGGGGGGGGDGGKLPVVEEALTLQNGVDGDEAIALPLQRRSTLEEEMAAAAAAAAFLLAL